MSFSAKVIAHSSFPGSPDIITLEISYPRFIHAEFMTHREFSRNASSSRAIPVPRALKMMLKDIAAPVHWGANQAGMQAHTELSGWRRRSVKAIWHAAAYGNAAAAFLMHKLGAHKQIVNRVTEPFSHIKVVVTSTNWSNFLALRDHEDAQPEIRVLAKCIRRTIEDSNPRLLESTIDWHLPYITDTELNELYKLRNAAMNTGWYKQNLIKASVARCARVSYNNFDGKPTSLEDDLKLYDKLVGSYPLHASPTEHQARPDPSMNYPKLCGNFVGWSQYRKSMKGEHVSDPDAWKN